MTTSTSIYGETEEVTIVDKLPSLSLSSVIIDTELLFFDESLDESKYSLDETQKIIDSINSTIDPMTSVSSSSSLPSVMETETNAIWDILSSSQNSNPKPFRKIITANFPVHPQLQPNGNSLTIPKPIETEFKSNLNSDSIPKKKRRQRPHTARTSKKGISKRYKTKKKNSRSSISKSLKKTELSKIKGKKKKKPKKKSYKIRDQNRFSSYLTSDQPRMWKYRSRARSQMSSVKQPKKKSKTKRRNNKTPEMKVYSKSLKKAKKNTKKIKTKTKNKIPKNKSDARASSFSSKKKRSDSILLQNVRSISDDSEVKVKHNRINTKCTHKKYADRKTKKCTKTVSKNKKKKKRKNHFQLSSISLSTTREMHSDSVTAIENSITPPDMNNSSQGYSFPEIKSVPDEKSDSSESQTPTYDSSNSTYESFPEAKDLSGNHINRSLMRTKKSLSMSALTMDEFFDESFDAIYGTFHQSFSSQRNTPLKLNTNAYLHPIPDATEAETEPEVEDEIVEEKEEKKEQIEKLINVWGKKVNEYPMTLKNKNVDKQMVLEWRFVSDDNIAHTVVLHHGQHSKKLKNKTKRMILVDGEMEYDQISNKCEFQLKIGDEGKIDFVIQIVFDKKGKQYSYPVTIDGICYAETFRLWMSKNKKTK